MPTFCGLMTDGMLDYLAEIWRLNGEREKVTPGALAEEMHVTAAAVSSMLKRLEEAGLAERSSADGVSLTPQGQVAALQLVRRHRLLEVFLERVMGFSWDQVDAEAHRLEHAISSEFEERIERLCGFPSRCPHGNMIPAPDGEIAPDPAVSLLSFEPGPVLEIRRIGTDDPKVLRYLDRLQLRPGSRIRVREIGPFQGPVSLEHLQTNGGSGEVGGASPEVHHLGHQLATLLYVERCGNNEGTKYVRTTI